MAGGFIYETLTSTFLLSLGLYHLISTTRHFLKSPHSFHAKPFHPLPLPSSRLRHLPLLLTLAALLLHSLHSFLLSFLPDVLLKGHSPVHHLTSLRSSSVTFLFAAIASLFLLSDATTTVSAHLPSSDVFFAAASAAFYLQSTTSSSIASLLTSALQSHCLSLSSSLSLLSSLFSLSLALFPKLYLLDLSLSASLCLHGLWAFQTALSLHVDAFIPDGCHVLLDVAPGIQGSTKCELEESRLRAVALLDLAFVVHVFLVVLLVFAVYGLVSKGLGVSRRFGSYDPLPTTADPVANHHVQLKTFTGTQA